MTATQEHSVSAAPVLVVGGTGHLGRRLVQALAARGVRMRALVREGSDAAALAQHGAEVVRGDLLDRASLVPAIAGVRAVVSTAAGYTRRRKSDTADVDDLGHRNLIDAAREAGVGRFVLTSILNCDQAPEVPHFASKARVERYLQDAGVPFVILRPGAFIDQPMDVWANGLRKGRLPAVGDADVPWTHVHTREIARCLALAVDADGVLGRRIDIGCDAPVSARQVARVASSLLGREVRLKAVPWGVASTGARVMGVFDSRARDFRVTFAYFLTGKYVADTAGQARYFGSVPSFESAMRTYLEDAGLLPAPADGA